MRTELLAGLAAGAAGTAAINATTYLDMAVRGRPSSSTPARTVGALTSDAGLALSTQGRDSPAASHRRSGLGALLGYLSGAGVGVAFGLARPHLRWLPWPVAGVGAGAAAMVGTIAPMTVLGVTDPRQWPPASWAADVVPHVVYGLVTAVTFDAIADAPTSRRTSG